MRTFETTVTVDEENDLCYVYLPHMRELAEGRLGVSTLIFGADNQRVHVDLDRAGRVVGVELRGFQIQAAK